MCFHLLNFIILVSLAYNDGQSFQNYWAIHIVVVLSLFVFNSKKERNTYYVHAIYLIVIPCMFIYQLTGAYGQYEISLHYWVLNIVNILSLFAALPFVYYGKEYYFQAARNA